MERMNQTKSAVAGLVTILIIVGLIVGSLFGLWAGYKAMERYQRVADNHNEIEVNRQRIQQTEQLVELEKQNAQIRIEEAHGIAESQRIIDESLTPYYLQYLAIQAQMEMSRQPNHSSIFLPISEGGLPFVYGLEDIDTPTIEQEEDDS
jgi:hypothetical protein